MASNDVQGFLRVFKREGEYMDILQQLFMQQPKIKQAIDHISTGEAQDELVTGLTGSAKSIFIETMYRQANRPVYIIVPTLLYAQRMVNELTSIVSEEEIFYYPADDFIAADVSTTSHELRAERIATLDAMRREVKGIYVLPIDAFRRVVAPKEQWATYFLAASVGQEIAIEEWLLKLVIMGYRRSEMVTTPGEFSVRGGILDIYPPYMQQPVRIELFDTEVDSIRTFSADDQRSIDRLTAIEILPATEVVLPIAARQQVAQRLQQALDESLTLVNDEATKERLALHIGTDISLLQAGDLPQYVMKYGSLLYDEEVYLESYFATDGIVLGDEMIRIQETMNVWRTEEEAWYMEMIDLRVEEGKRVNVEKELIDFSRNLDKEVFKRFESEIKTLDKEVLSQFKQKGNGKLVEIKKSLIAYGDRFAKIFEENGLTVNDFAGKTRGIANALLGISKEKFDFRDKGYILKQLRELMDGLVILLIVQVRLI